MTSTRGRAGGLFGGFGPALLLLVGVSCAHAPASQVGGFRVDCNLADATIWIDDVMVGSASSWTSRGRQIRAGFHRIEIRHPGYYSIFKEIDLAVGAETVVVAKLRETID